MFFSSVTPGSQMRLLDLAVPRTKEVFQGTHPHHLLCLPVISRKSLKNCQELWGRGGVSEVPGLSGQGKGALVPAQLTLWSPQLREVIFVICPDVFLAFNFFF